MTPEEAKAVFTRTHQTLGMLFLIDRYKDRDDISVKHIYDAFLEQYHENRRDYCLVNHQFIIGCLSAFILFPNESFNDIPKVEIPQLAENWVISSRHIKLSLDRKGKRIEINLPTFIKRIRNSIAHGRITAVDGAPPYFRFEDKYNGQKEISFISEISFNETLRFVTRFNMWCITKK